MRKAEQKVWDAMKRNAPKGIWMQRVENLAGDGMPDVYVEGPWVELKAGKLPKRATTRIQYSEGVRTSQSNWHKKAASRGVVSYVLVRVEEKVREPLLFAGTQTDKINNMSWDEASSSAIAIGWEAIFERVTS